ncbi:ABC transporter permease subunit [Hoeflea alexandrii]|uniref:ABC transporter permease subunit n=1 Tax=Hoeflea alexandrii TaxID=288436 RepID=UPI0022AF0BDD|nr:ABC transporter permease subunit [Hoeflea alexandrii]
MKSLLASRKARAFLLQAVFLIAIVGVLAGAYVQGSRNIAARGITSGFEFLTRTTGFNVGFKLIDYSGYDSFARLILVGLLNTLFLGLLGIVAANIVGLVVAMLRTARNPILNLLGTIYIEIFRNIPMILQVVFWYALLTHLPPPKEALQGLGSFISSRGTYIPGLNVSAEFAAISCAIALAAVMGIVTVSMSRKLSRLNSARLIRWAIALFAVCAVALTLALGHEDGTPLMSMPELRGLNIRDGIRIPPEFLSLLIGMAIYGGAYIAEIIRAGFLSVGKGQAEAAQSLGLTPWQVFSRVRLPLAIRAVLPTLINQYVWLFKATTLGIVVGYTDFFAVISVSINQAGQTLELIGILMLGFLIMNNTIAFLLNRVNDAIALKGSQLRS